MGSELGSLIRELRRAEPGPTPVFYVASSKSHPHLSNVVNPVTSCVNLLCGPPISHGSLKIDIILILILQMKKVRLNLG